MTFRLGVFATPLRIRSSKNRAKTNIFKLIFVISLKTKYLTILKDKHFLSWLADIVWQKSHNSGRGTTPSLVLKPELSNEFYVRIINRPDGDIIPIVVELKRPSNEFVEGYPYARPGKPKGII